MGKISDIAGKTYGRLTVVSQAGKSDDGHILWLCDCECGNSKVLNGHHLRRGNTKSCGCLATETHTTHGQSVGGASREYAAWANIKNRCYSPKNKHYKDYGSRGIEMCKRWKDSVDNFIEDMGQRPSSCHSIERINNDGNYEPGNCKWATKREQANNTRNNRILTHNGKSMSISQWARELGIGIPTLNGRLQRDWSTKKALETPVLTQYANKGGSND